MNDEFTDLENELRLLAPRAAAPALVDRIAAALDRPAPAAKPAKWWQRLGFNRPVAAFGWGVFSPLASAAVVLLVTHFPVASRTAARPENHPSPSGETALGNAAIAPGNGADASATLEAAHTSNVVYKTLDEGVVLDGSQEPVHRVRYLSADLVQWRNPHTGAHWEVAYPREDVRLVPVQAD